MEASLASHLSQTFDRGRERHVPLLTQGACRLCFGVQHDNLLQRHDCVRWCHHLSLVLPVGVLIGFLVSHWSRNLDHGCWEFGYSPHRVFKLCIPVEVNMNVVVSFEFVVHRGV